MYERGGRRIPTIACAAALALLAAACSGGSDKKEGAEAPADAEVTAGGGTSSGATSGFLSLDSGTTLVQGFNAAPGLSVRGTASGTVSADLAFVVVVPAPGDLDIGVGLAGGGIEAADRKAVLDSVSALGIARGDISFETNGGYGQARVQVKVPVAQLVARGPRVVQAVERTLGRSRSSGATFSVANCEPAAAAIRKQAIQQAEAQAKAMADTAKLTLGAVISMSQDGLARPSGSGGCPLVATGQLEPFDAKPEARLSVGVSVTYAVGGAPAAGSPARPLLWAGGSATAKAKADEAYVLVLFESEDEEPTGGPTAEDRTRILDGLGKLKIDRKAVEITSRSDFGVTTIVQVETKAEGLATSAKDIVRAVEDVLGRADSSGVRFGSSGCAGLLAKARKDAVADARQRAGSLAEAAGVKLGELQSISEFTPTGADPCDDSIDAVLGSQYDYSPLQPFDAEPELALIISAQLGFAVS